MIPNYCKCSPIYNAHLVVVLTSTRITRHIRFPRISYNLTDADKYIWQIVDNLEFYKND